MEPAFNINEFVHPACLPTKSVQTGKTCYASGWGRISDFRIPNKLMFTALEIFDYDACYDELKQEIFNLDLTSFQLVFKVGRF